MYTMNSFFVEPLNWKLWVLVKKWDPQSLQG